MKLKHSWRKRFADSINKELSSNAREPDKKSGFIRSQGVLDAVYLLGESINFEEYSYASGYRKFLDDFGIKVVTHILVGNESTVQDEV